MYKIITTEQQIQTAFKQYHLEFVRSPEDFTNNIEDVDSDQYAKDVTEYFLGILSAIQASQD